MGPSVFDRGWRCHRLRSAENIILYAAMPMMFLLQAASGTTDPVTYPLVSLGVGGGIAALVLSLWRTDRKDSQERYAALARESQDRYAALARESNERAAAIATDFRGIVQENTKALQLLADKQGSSEDRCALAELLIEILKKNKPINLEP